MWRWFRKQPPESDSARRRRASGVPENPDDFMRWSIDRHARSERMVVSQDDITTLPPEMARLSATLRHLILRHAGLRDISALAGMQALETLEITACPVEDLRCLADLPGLRSLTLSLPKGAAPDLPDMPGLERLKLVCSDPVALPALPALRSLWAQNLGSLAAVAAMPGLESLTVIGLADADFAPLTGKTALRALELRARRARDLTPLAGLSGLRSLKLANGIVSDIGPVGHLTGLEVLHLSAPRARSLGPLAGLHRLRELRIEAPLPDSGEDWLPRAAPLRSLFLTEPGTLEPIRGFDGLEMLILSFSRPLDLRPLAGMGALRVLNLLAEGDWTETLSLPPLEGVEKITLRGAAFASLDGLQVAAALRELHLHGTEVTTLDPLAGLPLLERIEVTQTPLNDVTALAFLPRFGQQGQARLLLRGTDLASRHPELARFETMHPRDAHEYSTDTAWQVAQHARALVKTYRA